MALSLPSLILRRARRARNVGKFARTITTFPSASLFSTSTEELADRCDLHLVSSPFPPIEPAPYPPLYEFVSSNWTPNDGYLDDKVAIIDGSTGLQRTFTDYYSTSGRLAAALDEMGVGELGCVAMYSPNHVDYLPVALAVSLTGAKMTPINPLYTVQELSSVLVHSRSSVLFAHISRLDVALEAAKNCEHVKHVIVITDGEGESIPEGTVDLESLRHHKQASHETHHVVHNDTSTHAFLLPYSSGTTGLPKGVCLTHGNLVANLLQFDEIEGIPFPPSQKLITPLPFFHIYAFTVGMLYCAWRGQTLITMSKKFDLETYCRLVEEHQPERTHLVPPIMIGLAKHPLVDKYDMSSLRMIVSAAAPLGSDTEEAIQKRLRAQVKQGWGMSELSPLGALNSDFHIRSGSVGPLCSSTVGKVVDENGQSLGPDQPGELLVKGPQVMMGYFNEPDKTAECLSPSGWLRTGDLARYDADGFLYITDRIKELIKVRGYPVAPAELEALLLTHEAVNDAAVIQVPDENSGELPRAYIVLKETEEAKGATKDGIYDWVKERVAPYKRLDGGIVFCDFIPKSASGKILRRILRDEVAAETKE